MKDDEVLVDGHKTKDPREAQKRKKNNSHFYSTPKTTNNAIKNS